MSKLTSANALGALGILIAVCAIVLILAEKGPVAGVEVPGISPPSAETLAPNWEKIAQWPGEEAEGTHAPDPDRLTTVIVLDDSGSMSAEMADAKQAVLAAAQQLPEDGRLAVLALNSGMVLRPMSVPDAQSALGEALAQVSADGSTPLGARTLEATRILSAEAAMQRGFGTYRLVITTDGQASDEDALRDAIVEILSSTPIEVATIGLGIGEGHLLNMPGQVRYVSIASVDELAAALSDATAEQTSFDPITQFSE